MTITRRGFLGALLAASAAPAIVRAHNLMPLYAPPRLVLWGDGVHDDTEAANAVLTGRREVRTPAGVVIPTGVLVGHHLRITRTLIVPAGSTVNLNFLTADFRNVADVRALEICSP